MAHSTPSGLVSVVVPDLVVVPAPAVVLVAVVLHHRTVGYRHWYTGPSLQVV